MQQVGMEKQDQTKSMLQLVTLQTLDKIQEKTYWHNLASILFKPTEKKKSPYEILNSVASKLELKIRAFMQKQKVLKFTCNVCCLSCLDAWH